MSEPLDQMIEKGMAMARRSEQSVETLLQQVERGQLGKAKATAKRLVESMQESAMDIQTLGDRVKAALQQLMTGGDGLLAHYREIGLLLEAMGRNKLGVSQEICNVLNIISQRYDKVIELVGSYVIEDVYAVKYGLHKRQLLANRYNLHKLRLTECEGVYFYEDMAPNEEDLIELNAQTYVTKNDILAYCSLPIDIDIHAAISLVGGAELEKTAMPHWMQKERFLKLSWFKFNDMVALKQYIKGLDGSGQTYKDHYLVKFLNLNMCLDCRKTYKKLPGKPCEM